VVPQHPITYLLRCVDRPKLRRRIDAEDAVALLEWLARSAIVAPDPEGAPPRRSPDPGDDYLIALAAARGAALVSSDQHLLGLAGQIPVSSPADFLDLLRREQD
jgi:predicted nucleic acid-binding protein